MNNNFKNFLKEKKDLLIFIGVLIMAVVGVAVFLTIWNARRDGYEKANE